jgi:hypothetical protein
VLSSPSGGPKREIEKIQRCDFGLIGTSAYYDMDGTERSCVKRAVAVWDPVPGGSANDSERADSVRSETRRYQAGVG